MPSSSWGNVHMQATRIIVWFVSDCKCLRNYICKSGIALENLESSQCAVLPWCKQLCINSISFYRVFATPASKCSDQDFSSIVLHLSFPAVSWVPSKQPLPLQLQRDLPRSERNSTHVHSWPWQKQMLHLCISKVPMKPWPFCHTLNHTSSELQDFLLSWGRCLYVCECVCILCVSRISDMSPESWSFSPKWSMQKSSF